MHHVYSPGLFSCLLHPVLTCQAPKPERQSIQQSATCREHTKPDGCLPAKGRDLHHLSGEAAQKWHGLVSTEWAPIRGLWPIYKASKKFEHGDQSNDWLHAETSSWDSKLSIITTLENTS